MNYTYSISAEDLLKIYPEAIELAKQRGKKEGEDFGEELFEIAKKYNIKINYLGATEKDAGLLTGDAREEGKKVLNINEEMNKRVKYCQCKEPNLDTEGITSKNCSRCGKPIIKK